MVTNRTHYRPSVGVAISYCYRKTKHSSITNPLNSQCVFFPVTSLTAPFNPSDLLIISKACLVISASKIWKVREYNVKFQDADIDLIFVPGWKKEVTFGKLEHLLKIKAPLARMICPFSSSSNQTKIFAIDPSI